MNFSFEAGKTRGQSKEHHHHNEVEDTLRVPRDNGRHNEKTLAPGVESSCLRVVGSREAEVWTFELAHMIFIVTDDFLPRLGSTLGAVRLSESMHPEHACANVAAEDIAPATVFLARPVHPDIDAQSNKTATRLFNLSERFTPLSRSTADRFVVKFVLSSAFVGPELEDLVDVQELSAGHVHARLELNAKRLGPPLAGYGSVVLPGFAVDLKAGEDGWPELQEDSPISRAPGLMWRVSVPYIITPYEHTVSYASIVAGLRAKLSDPLDWARPRSGRALTNEWRELRNDLTGDEHLSILPSWVTRAREMSLCAALARSFCSVVEEVARYHEQRVALCDIKPDNVALGAGATVIDLDFVSTEGSTMRGDNYIWSVKGSPHYLSPELLGECRRQRESSYWPRISIRFDQLLRSDVHALALTALEIISPRPIVPFFQAIVDECPLLEEGEAPTFTNWSGVEREPLLAKLRTLPKDTQEVLRPYLPTIFRALGGARTQLSAAAFARELRAVAER